MNDRPFVDHYEILQVSQGAETETIERVFRLLAKRYHPDNADSGSEDRFREVHDAYEVLMDPTRRAEYDVQYDKNKSMQWKLFEQGAAVNSREDDKRIFHGILSLLYVARRRNPESGGLGSVKLEQMLGVPREHLEFPVWYLKKRGWIETLPSGELAITVDGIDKISTEEMSFPDTRMLPGPELQATGSEG